MNWSSGNGGSPAYLEEGDFQKIISSDKYFARKVKSNHELRHLLKCHCQVKNS
jgi:hypothetical protein